MATDWGSIAGRVALAYGTGGASEAMRYGGGGGGGGGGGLINNKEGNRFGPVLVSTGMGKIDAMLAGDTMPGMGNASDMMGGIGLDQSGMALGNARIPWLYVLLAVGAVLAIKKRKAS